MLSKVSSCRSATLLKNKLYQWYFLKNLLKILRFSNSFIFKYTIQFPHSVGRLAFSQNFHTMKLGEATIFFAVIAPFSVFHFKNCSQCGGLRSVLLQVKIKYFIQKIFPGRNFLKFCFTEIKVNFLRVFTLMINGL